LRVLAATLVLVAFGFAQMRPAQANTLALASAAWARGDYVRAVNILTPLALRGNANAQAFLGFMYENGFGAPQAYDAAADLYFQAATRGNPFAQCMLGLMYDKGHGVPQDFILALRPRAPRNASANIICGFAMRWRRRCPPSRLFWGSAWRCCGRPDDDKRRFVGARPHVFSTDGLNDR